MTLDLARLTQQRESDRVWKAWAAIDPPHRCVEVGTVGPTDSTAVMRATIDRQCACGKCEPKAITQSVLQAFATPDLARYLARILEYEAKQCVA